MTDINKLIEHIVLSQDKVSSDAININKYYDKLKYKLFIIKCILIKMKYEKQTQMKIIIPVHLTQEDVKSIIVDISSELFTITFDSDSFILEWNCSITLLSYLTEFIHFNDISFRLV